MFEDATDHGTSVAAIIASSGVMTELEGINPYAEIYSVRVLDENNDESEIIPSESTPPTASASGKAAGYSTTSSFPAAATTSIPFSSAFFIES